MARRLTIKDLGGSCVTPKVKGRRNEDYDGYNDYNSFVIEERL